MEMRLLEHFGLVGIARFADDLALFYSGARLYVQILSKSAILNLKTVALLNRYAYSPDRGVVDHLDYALRHGFNVRSDVAEDITPVMSLPHAKRFGLHKLIIAERVRDLALNGENVPDISDYRLVGLNCRLGSICLAARGGARCFRHIGHVVLHRNIGAVGR